MDGKQIEERLAAIGAEKDSLIAIGEKQSLNDEQIARFNDLEVQEAQSQRDLESYKIVQRSKAKAKVERQGYSPNYTVTTRGGSVQDGSRSLQAWCLTQMGYEKDIADCQREALERCGVSASNRMFDPTKLVIRQQSTTAGEGGNLLNGSQFMGLEAQLKDYGDMLNIASVVQTPDGNDKHLGTVDGTTVVARPVEELVDADDASYAFDKIPWKAHVYGMSVGPISKQLVTDVDFDFAGWLNPQIAEAHYRGWNLDFIEGDGDEKPYGLLEAATGAMLGHTTDLSSTFTPTDIRKLIFSIDPAYRRLSKFGVMMHDSIYGMLWDWVDDNNAPKFLTSVRESGELRVFGYPIYVNNNMPDTIEAGEPIMVAGAFSKYIIRQVHGVELTPLTETYAKKYGFGITSHSRIDGRLSNRKAVKYLMAKAA